MKLGKDNPVYYKDELIKLLKESKEKSNIAYYNAEIIKLLETAVMNGIEIRFSKLPYTDEVVISFLNHIRKIAAVLTYDEFEIIGSNKEKLWIN